MSLRVEPTPTDRDSCPGPSWSARAPAALVGRLPAVGTVLFTVGWVTAGLSHADYSPRREYISGLYATDAAAPWVMIVCTIVFGAGVIALAHQAWVALRGFAGRSSALCALLCGAGIVVAGLAQQDCSVQVTTCMDQLVAAGTSTNHQVHDAASATGFSMGGLAQLLVAISSRDRAGWGRIRVASAGSGALTAALFALMSLSILSSWSGLIERTLLVIAGAWVCVISHHLHRTRVTPRRQVRPDPR